MLHKKKKFFKILSVLVAVIIAFSLFCIPASAEEKQTLYTDFWTFNRSDSKIWLVDSENNDNLVDITTSAEFTILENGKGMGVILRTGQDFDVGTVFYFNMVFDLNPEYIKPGYSSLKFELYEFNNHTEWTVDQTKYSPWSYRVGNYQIDNVWRRDYQATHSTPDWNTKGIKINFDTQYAEYGFKGVNVFAYCTLNQPMTEGSYHHVYFGFYNLDYRYSTDGEYLNNRVIENQNENTDKIISNADKNAADIQANQDKNTDKILNGGSDTPHYSSADTTVTDDYHSKEQEVFNQTASARSSTVNFFNNFGALLNDTPVQRGLLAVSKIMTEFFSIGWLSGIIEFALALGAFAFILGSVIMVVGKFSAKQSRSERSAYYKAKTDYYNSRRKK